MHSTRLIHSLACALLLFPAAAHGQETPVYVDDSPIAWEMFREAQDQASVNVGEAVRLYQDILDEFALRLIHADSRAAHRYQAARLRVLDALMSDRSHGGLLERHRMRELAESQRLHRAGDFDRLILTRPWTEPGLDALLRVAQKDIESARFDAAKSLLELAIRHPDLPADSRAASYAWFMSCVAAHFTDDEAASLAALDHLQDMAAGGQRLAAELAEQLSELLKMNRPAIDRGISPLDIGSMSPSVSLAELVAEEIWSVALSDTLYSRRFHQNAARAQTNRGRDQARGDGLLMTAAPTVVSGNGSGLIYVNQGHHILALDRFTGSPMWPLVGGYVERPPLTIIDREDDHARDLNVIAIEHDALVTLTGHAHATSRSNDGSVLCLNANTGEFRWSTRLDRIAGAGIDEGENEGLYPHSAPVIAEGMVFVLARKISPQSLMSTYLVALNLEDGSPAWIRHIASSGSVRRAARTFSTLVYRGGDLYLNTAVGAVARVTASTGETQWLHRFVVPLNPSSAEHMRRPWELDAPVVTRDFVINLLPAVPGGANLLDGQRILVLDRRTGMEVVTLNAADAGWGAPAYLLSAGVDSPWVFAVGREIRAIHVDALHEPLWIWPRRNADDAYELQGRVHVVGDDMGDLQDVALIAPSNVGILVFNALTGNVINRLDIASASGTAGMGRAWAATGNPVVVDSQLFIADNERLSSFMALNHAVGMLRERMESNPADPEPGMALLRLAIAAAHEGGPSAGTQIGEHGPYELILSTSRSVMRSITLMSSSVNAAGAQSRLFSLLMTLNVAKTARRNQEGESLFDLVKQVIAIGEASQAPDAVQEQRVDYLLAYGDWLATQPTRSTQAANAFEAVIKEHSLATVKRREGDVIRSGAEWAQRRLSALTGRAHASHFPASREQRASTILPHIGHQRGDAVLVDGAVVRPHGRAISGNGEAIDHNNRSVLLINGSNLHRLTFNTPARQSDGLSFGWQVNLARAFEVDGMANQTVSSHWIVNADRIALWIAGHRSGGGLDVAGGRLALINSKTGAPIWTTLDGESMFGETPRRRRDASGGRESGFEPARGAGGFGREIGHNESREPFDPAEMLPLVSGHHAFLIRRDGYVAKIDLNQGPTPAWISPRLLDEVHHAATLDDIVVLAGLTRDRSSSTGTNATRRHEALKPIIVVLKAETGHMAFDDQPLHLLSGESIGQMTELRTESNRLAITWMHLDGHGLLLCGTADGVQAWNVKSGSFLWMNTAEKIRGSARGWLAGGKAVVETHEGDLISLDLSNAGIAHEIGSTANTLGGAGGRLGVWGPVRDVIVDGALPENGRILVHHPQRIAWYDANGRAVGADSIQDERNFRWVLPASDRVIAINAHQPQQQPLPGRLDGSGGGRRTHHVYSIYALSDNGRLLDEPLQLPALFEPVRDAHLVDGWLMLSTSTHTIAVPFPAER